MTAHGELSSALLYSVGMIAGQQDPEQVAAVNFYPNDSLDTLKDRLEEQIKKFDPENNHIIEYSLKLDSNPEFTASVIVAYARATYRMFKEGMSGCKTVFDVPPAYLSAKSREELLAHML